MAAGTESAAIPSASDIQASVKSCIATLFCQRWNKLKVGKKADVETRMLKTLYLACNIKLWEDLGEEFSKFYCQIPQCLEQNC